MNTPKRVIVLSSDPELRKSASAALESAGLPAEAEAGSTAFVVEASEGGLPRLDQVERLYIEFVLAETRFNLSRASRILAIDRTTLYNKLRRYGLTRQSMHAVAS